MEYLLLSNDPILVHVEDGEVGVAVRQVKLDSRLHVRATGAELAFGELEPIR
jgi:hypothetical protein